MPDVPERKVRKVYVPLAPEVFDVVVRDAAQERRHPSAHAALLIEEALKARGLLST